MTLLFPKNASAVNNWVPRQADHDGRLVVSAADPRCDAYAKTAANWRNGVVFLILTFLSTTVISQSNAGDWRLPRGDAQSTGSTDAKLPDKLAERWTFKADEAIASTPVVADDTVFVADDFGKIYAIDRNTGKKRWDKDYDTGFIASAVIQDKTLFIGDVEGNVYALNVADGSERWKKTTNGEISGSAAIYKDNVLFASQDGKLYCLKAKDGSEVWTYQADDQIRCSPTIAGDRTFLGGCDGKLHVINLDTGNADGEPLPLAGPTGSTPAISGTHAFLPIMDGIVYAFDWKQRKEVWAYEDPNVQQEYRNSPAVRDGKVIVSSQRKQIDCIDAKTGDRIWRKTIKRFAEASPVIAGDDVWIAASDGRLIRFALADGKEKWSYEIKGSFIAGPAVTDSELFIGDDKGVVRCFAQP